MNADRWIKILKAIEPDIVKLTQTMNYDIQVNISPLEDEGVIYHILCISESHDMRDWAWALPKLEESIEWAQEQLKTWKDCSQVEHNSWGFINKKDAEKFKTLFTLKWTQ